MPIGVPKVPYRIPRDEEATWVDLYNVMYRERILFFRSRDLLRDHESYYRSHVISQYRRWN